MFRLIGVIITLVIIGLLFVMMRKGSENAINANPAVQEQKQILQQATGVDANDKKALQDYTLKQAQEIQQYQQQLDAAPSGE